MDEIALNISIIALVASAVLFTIGYYIRHKIPKHH